ncbi:unnamed protein product [Effrenium voratum]|uniref:Hexose transporter 1 n=1 Tax=Effrenium voratum TaxID=2562239 RepID=A0AA36IX54_9DINO|nr:unnamed protein product [Effrenium voratum]
MQADDDDNERKNGKVDLPLEAPNFGIATQAVYAGVLSSFLYGYHLCNLNSCMDFIGLHFQWCKSHTRIDCLASAIDGGLINAILYLGAAAGALLVGRPFMVNYGSRVQLVISDVFFMAGGIFGAFAIGIKCLLLSRLLSGIGLGISAISAPVFIAEVSPAECRGWHAAKHGLYIAVGLLAAELVGLPQDPPDQGLTERNGWWWRAILGLPLLLAGFQFVIFKYDLPVDSVSFLVRQGRMDEARIMLYKTYGLPPPQLEPGLGDHVAKLELKLKDLAVVAAEAGITRRITILQALTDPYLRCSVVVGFFLASYQQLTGINALMAYSNTLFAQAGIPADSLTLASVLMCVANVLVSVLSTKLVDSLGRRTLLLWGSATQTVAMASMVYVVHMMPRSSQGLSAFIFFSLFVVSWNYGLGAITWLWLSEIYPMEIRGPALSACGVIKWLSCFFIVLIARFLNLHSSCVLFGTVSGLGVVGMWLWVLETRGCDMEDSPMTPRSERSTSILLGGSNQASPRSAQLKQMLNEDPIEEPEQQEPIYLQVD